MRKKLMDIVCESIATDRCVVYCSHPHCGLVQTVVQKLIANGVTIPVRCKDCEHWDNATVNKKGFLICKASGMEIMATDFCSYGERKNDD